MTRHPDDGQPRSGRALRAVLGLFALLLLVAAIAFLARPHWVSALLSGGGGLPVLSWLAASAAPLLALATAGVALLSLLALHRAGREAPQAEPSPPGETSDMERLRRQVAPLATGDLAIRLPDGPGPRGEVARTLNLLVGAASDLARVTDEAAVQLLALVQDLRAGAGRLQAEGEQGGQLASGLTEHARQAAASARALADRIKGAELSAGRGARRAAGEPAASDAQPSVAVDVATIVEVVADLAEQAHVLAVEIGIQGAAVGDPSAFQAIGDEARRIADRAAGAVRRIEPLVDSVVAAGEVPAGDRLRATSRQAVSLAGAAATLADQLGQLPESGARLQDIAARLGRERDELEAILGALSEVAQRLRRATGRFRVPE